jgi:hypothetical protein
MTVPYYVFVPLLSPGTLTLMYAVCAVQHTFSSFSVPAVVPIEEWYHCGAMNDTTETFCPDL